MAGPNGGERAATGESAQAEATGRPAESDGAPQPKAPYDDLLCTICGLKACWMTPEAAGQARSKG